MNASFTSLTPRDTQRRVSVFIGNRFLGNANIKEIISEDGESYAVLSYPTWIWPSRNPGDSERLLFLLESCMFPDLESNMTGEVTFKGRNVSWKVRGE